MEARENGEDIPREREVEKKYLFERLVFRTRLMRFIGIGIPCVEFEPDGRWTDGNRFFLQKTVHVSI